MKNNNISFSQLLIQPYTPTTPIAHNRPGTELFDSRHHFILNPRTTHIAVSILAHNLLHTPDRSRAARGTFHVNLRHSDTAAIIASKTLHMRIEAGTESAHTRIDLPVTPAAINIAQPYSVEVIDPQSGSTLISTTAMFFDAHTLPVHYFHPVEAYLLNPHGDNPETRYTDLDANGITSCTVAFTLQSMRPEGSPLPELSMRIIDNMEHVSISPCTLTPNPYIDGQYTATVTLPLDKDCLGLYYFELTCLGHPFTAATTLILDSSTPGTILPDDLVLIPDYTFLAGCQFLSKRHENDELRRKQQELNLCRETLDSLVGIESVKQKIRNYSQLTAFNGLRRKAGLTVTMPPLHALFMGSPGTGKTTVAKLMGKLLKDAGILSSGHVVVRERATLLGQYYSSEAEKTLEAIKEAEGGILFIDEAYQLNQPNDPRDPGRFVLETLMTALADESRRDWMLILAGYTEPTQKLLALNPGLTSRIPESNFYYFDDLNATQLFTIANDYFASHDFKLTPEAAQALSTLIEHDYAHRTSDFGNARHIHNIIQTGILPAMAARIAQISNPDTTHLTTVMDTDIPRPALFAILPATRPHVGFRIA